LWRTHSAEAADVAGSTNTRRLNRRTVKTQAALKTVTGDPVCGMYIDVSRAFNFVDYSPHTYFCSKDRLRKFNERPEYFAEIERMERRYIA
jgi:YHS domain-containing protein